MSDPPPLFPSQNVVGHDLAGKAGRRELGQRRVFLRHDFVDVCTDHDNVGVGEQRFDGFNGLPVVQTARDRCAGRRNQRSVEPVDVQGEVDGAREFADGLKPPIPDGRTGCLLYTSPSPRD